MIIWLFYGPCRIELMFVMAIETNVEEKKIWKIYILNISHHIYV